VEAKAAANCRFLLFLALKAERKKGKFGREK
jgi:hypothetical protein